MHIQSKLVTRLGTAISLVLALCSCAAPVTKEISLSKQEVQQEQAAQRAMAHKYPPKKLKARQHQDLAIYQARLDRVYPALLKATQQVCKKGNCNFSFKIANQNVLNAWADGKSVNITPIMMDFLDSDKELALILAHELSHNVMGHINKKMQNVLLGLVLDVAVAAAGGIDTRGAFGGAAGQAYSQAFENEADYVGIYIMAIAGYDVSNLNNVWRKMSVEDPHSINGSFFGTHPSNPERYLRMKKAIDEVKAKKAAGKPLLPELK